MTRAKPSRFDAEIVPISGKRTQLDPRSEFRGLFSSFKLHLKALNRSPNTIESYESATERFLDWLIKNGHPTAPRDVTRAHLEGFISYLLENFEAATALNRFKALQQFFRWASDPDEGELDSNPMLKMRPPALPEKIVPVLSDAEVQRLLDACKGKQLEDRRDAALISVLIDTGARREEIAGLRYTPENPDNNDVDLQLGRLRVIGKGNRERVLPLGIASMQALDRYVRIRARHRYAHLPNLWVGRVGPLTKSGIRDVVEKRAKRAGLDRKVFPHLFRHTFAHVMKSSGLSDENLRTLGGWRSDAMVRRYGQSAAAERAFDAHRELSPRDRFE